MFEDHDHSHMNLGDEDAAHTRAHAADIRKRFEGRTVTTWQIVLFGLTGGLIPCPAAITVLLLCIQLKQFSLGSTLVLCFGIGLAITTVSAGVLATLSPRHIERRWMGLAKKSFQMPKRPAAETVPPAPDSRPVPGIIRRHSNRSLSNRVSVSQETGI